MKLTENNAWCVEYYNTSGEEVESWMYSSYENAMEEAREFCRKTCPQSKSQLIDVNGERIVLKARHSNAIAVVKSPLKFTSKIKVERGGDENA